MFAEKGSFLRGLTAVGLESLGFTKEVPYGERGPTAKTSVEHSTWLFAFPKQLIFLSSSSLSAIVMEAILLRMMST